MMITKAAPQAESDSLPPVRNPTVDQNSLIADRTSNNVE